MEQKFPVPPLLKEISGYFKNAGFSAYLVGGAVRDFFFKKEANDWDIATDAPPQEVTRLFRRTIPTGIEHGTVTVIYKNKHIECTTFRTESEYIDGRHPAAVSYTATIEDDLARRDFTMNAIAVSLPDGRIVDPFNGRADIRAGLIQTVGNPLDRFLEDGLRPVRAIRFAAQLGFTVNVNTLAAISQALHITQKISIERFREEFTKMLACPAPLTGLHLMESTGLLKLFIPELIACRGVRQGSYHRFDVLDHSFLVCNACPAGMDHIHIRLAGLFHDIGKPAVRKEAADGSCTFYRHEAVSEKMTRSIMRRLKYSNAEIDKTAHLVAEHMFHYDYSWTDAAVRRFIVRVGKENIDDLFALRKADVFGLTGTYTEPYFLVEFTARINKILKEEGVYSLKDLAVNGKDLMAIGIPAGKHLGLVLHDLLETVLDDPAQNTKEALLPIAAALYERIQRFQ